MVHLGIINRLLLREKPPHSCHMCQIAVIFNVQQTNKTTNKQTNKQTKNKQKTNQQTNKPTNQLAVEHGSDGQHIQQSVTSLSRTPGEWHQGNSYAATPSLTVAHHRVDVSPVNGKSPELFHRNDTSSINLSRRYEQFIHKLISR